MSLIPSNNPCKTAPRPRAHSHPRRPHWASAPHTENLLGSICTESPPRSGGSPHSGSKSPFSIALTCTTRRRIPAGASTNQGPARIDLHRIPTQVRGQPSERQQIVIFNRLDLYHTPPDSGGRQYKSRIVWSGAVGCWQADLTERDYQVVSQKSTPAQIRQIILYYY